MAPGWESRPRDSFELELEHPPPRRNAYARFLNKRFIIIGASSIILIFLLYVSTYHSTEIIQTILPDKHSSFTDKPAIDHTNFGIPIHPPEELTPPPPGSVTATTTPSEPSGQLSTTKVAAIVETRPLANLVPLILHFSAVLGPEWPIHIFTGGQNLDLFSSAPSFQRGVDEGRFRVRALESNAKMNTHAAVSSFFTASWFWEQFTAEHILLFQPDSILCSNSARRVEDFLEYDFVGAPIDTHKGGVVYNGGLSLRNRTLSLEITKKFDWQAERHGDHDHGNVDYEDQWFGKKMRELGAHLPTREIAMEFSVETMWYDQPLGYHQPIVWQKERMEEIEKWCPEIKMCMDKTFLDHNTKDFGGGNE